MPSQLSPHFPLLYFPVLVLLGGLLVETWLKRKQPWALPAGFLYLTVFAWYFTDLYLAPESYDFIPDSLLNLCYVQVAAFLVTYRLLVPRLAARLTRRATMTSGQSRTITPETLFLGTVVLWAALLAIGVAGMDGDLFGALFPLEARAGNLMWARGAAGGAGATGFLVSTGAYIYLLVSGSFGVWLFFLRKPVLQVLAVGFMLLSWPFFLLSGTRSSFLGVSLPFFLAYLLFARHPLWIRLVCLFASFLVLNSTLRVVVNFRGVGFQEFYEAEENKESSLEELQHQGLNMIQELCFVNGFAATHPPEYGTRYLVELTNVIPRAIWTDKPMLGIDYSLWRGFEGGDSDTGVVATISSGMIGGGVLNFGPWFGPLAPAALVALWTGLLARWWVQRASLLRCFLFLAGMGLTFNLGRDITLLVLWPVVFGYIIILLIERFTRAPILPAPQTATMARPSSLAPDTSPWSPPPPVVRPPAARL